MGLLNFLKNKFSKKQVEEEPVEEKVEAKQEVVTEKEEIKEVEKTTSDISNEKISEKKTEEVKKDLEIKESKVESNPIKAKPTKVECEHVTKKETEIKVDKIESKEEKIEDSNKVKEEAKENKAPLSTYQKQEIGIQNRDEETRAYVRGLRKSNKGFMSKLKSLVNVFHKVNDEYFDELEQILIEADVGVELSLDLIDRTKKIAKTNKIDDPKQINELLIDEMFESYQKEGAALKKDIEFKKDGPTVLLVIGVNGVGKTTTIAKLASRYKKQGKKILLVAGDTFRAGAVEQLIVWSKRIGIDILTGNEGADPSSLCYQGLQKAKAENFDLVIVDTAGRLQNKVNLMNELSKMKRVMGKIIPDAPHETFLIIDANTGQNGVEQARVFKEVTPISGIVITKMDGTSKGGIILAIREKLGIPVRFIGLGEGIDDLKEFDLDSYLYGLLIGDDDE